MRSETKALEHFDVSEHLQPAGVMFAYRLFERINAFICRKMGWTGAHHGYESVLEQD
jgi:hypothetical protein